jgi:two-component system nitrate/nitrite response regulator NarL
MAGEMAAIRQARGIMPELRVLIIADDPLARAGLAAVLADQVGLVVCGRASGMDDLRAAVELYRPDVLLWDAGWHPTPSLARLADLEARAPVAILLPDEADARQAWTAGARGLLRRDAEPARITAALAAAAHGFAVIEPDFAEALRSSLPDRAPSRSQGADRAALVEPLVESLTPRELEVLRLMAEGLPNKTIAARLEISEHTAKFHVNTILGKLGVASRTEAVVRATRLGLILL